MKFKKNMQNNMKNKLQKIIHWMAKNILTSVFCLVVIALGTAIVARATGVTTIGENISTNNLTAAGTTTLGTLNGILKGTSGAVGTATAGTDYEAPISAGTSGQYYRGDKTWQTLNQAAISGLTLSDSPTFGGLALSGNLNLQNNLIQNIGASGTDFTGTGGLTLADALTVSSGGAIITGNATVTGNLATTGDIAMDGKLSSEHSQFKYILAGDIIRSYAGTTTQTGDNCSLLWTMLNKGNNNVESDLCDDNNDGTYTNTTWNAIDTAGLLNMVYFSGNDYVEIPDSDSLSLGNGTTDSNHTIIVYLRPESFGSTKYLFTKTNGGEWGMRMNSSGQVAYGMKDVSAGGTVFVQTTETLTAGQDTLLVITYNSSLGSGNTAGDGVKIYFDGQLTTATTRTCTTGSPCANYTAMENSTSTVWLGGDIGDASFNGHIGLAAIFKGTALSASDVSQLWTTIRGYACQ